MQKSTLFYQFKKMVGGSKIKNIDNQLVAGVSELHEPSEQSIKNIMAFSKAYSYDESDAIGKIEYLSN